MVVGLVIIVVALWAIESRTQQQLREDAVAGCERVNEVRKQLHGFLLDAADARERAGSPADVQTSLEYRRRAVALVGAASEFPVEEGSPLVDCDSAYDAE